MYPRKWIYYIGNDVYPSTVLVEVIKKQTNMELFHLDHDKLARNKEIRTLVASDGDELLVATKYRDIFAAIDFFVCSSLSSFIGNSVSIFSATQIALRQGRNSSWYN